MTEPRDEPGHDRGTLVDDTVVCDECGDVTYLKVEREDGSRTYVGGMVNGRAYDHPEGPVNHVWAFDAAASDTSGRPPDA